MKSSSHAPVLSFSAVNFSATRAMESYPLLQEAEERELSLKSRLQRQDDSVASLVIMFRTRNFKKKEGLFHFIFFRFFLSNFLPVTISEGKVGFRWQVVLISVPITLPECMNRCTSCTSLARSSERLERVKYRWLSQGCVVTWICGEVQKMFLVEWVFPKMVVPNNHGFSYQKWSFWGVLGVPPF